MLELLKILLDRFFFNFSSFFSTSGVSLLSSVSKAKSRVATLSEDPAGPLRFCRVWDGYRAQGPNERDESYSKGSADSCDPCAGSMSIS